MKKIIKIVLCLCLSFAIVSISSEAASKSFSFTGSSAQQANDSSKFKLTKGKRYYFANSETINVRPNTKSRKIKFGNHLFLTHWYGDEYVVGKDLTKDIGNSSDKYKSFTYKYDFDRYINTEGTFYFNYGHNGASKDYDFTLNVTY